MKSTKNSTAAPSRIKGVMKESSSGQNSLQFKTRSISRDKLISKGTTGVSRNLRYRTSQKTYGPRGQEFKLPSASENQELTIGGKSQNLNQKDGMTNTQGNNFDCLKMYKLEVGSSSSFGWSPDSVVVKSQVNEVKGISIEGLVYEPSVRRKRSKSGREEDGVVPSVEKELKESVETVDKEGGGSDPVVRVVGCQINVRRNGELEVVVPGDPKLSQKLQILLRLRLSEIVGSSTITSKSPPVPPVKDSHLHTIQQLDTLEAQLNDPVVRRKMVEKMEMGNSARDSVVVNLGRLMTPDLAMELSWSGRGDKRSFKDLRLTSLLIHSILDFYPTSTVYTLEKTIKLWLKDPSQFKSLNRI